MDRRDFLLAGGGFALANVAASATACASNADEVGAATPPSGAAAMQAHGADPGHEGHEGHEGHAASPEASALASITGACVSAGVACLQHCLKMLQSGDTSMAGCSQRVHEMIPVCQATSTLAAADSEHLAAQAEVCKAVCTACKRECDKHAAKHAECKACADACQATLDALAKIG